MAALDYNALLATLVGILQSDDRLTAETTTDTDPPSADRCPLVQVALGGFKRTRRRIVAHASAGQPFDEFITAYVKCTAFSGQSAPDARRQLFDLVREVEQVVDDNPTLLNTIQLGDILAGDPTDAPQDGGGMFASMLLHVEIQALV